MQQTAWQICWNPLSPLMALGWIWWRAWVPSVASDAATFCVAAVALRDIDLGDIDANTQTSTQAFFTHTHNHTH